MLCVDVLWRGYVGPAADTPQGFWIVVFFLLRQISLMVSIGFAADEGAICLGGEFNFLSAGCYLAKSGHGRFNCAGNFSIDLIPEIARNAKTQGRRAFFYSRRIVNGRKFLAAHVLRVVSGNGLENECGIGGSAGHGANMVE